uniref:RING-type E3 ubiquitin transferase n=1 Tax=Rhizophora mucronata TaxID=61149 RepID=A0A2P2JA74_RHIMU
MAKFSVGGEEDGEGRSTFPWPKRQRTSSSSSSRSQQQSNPQTQQPPPQVNPPLPPTPMEAEPEIEEEEEEAEEDDERLWETEGQQEQEATGNNDDNQVAIAGRRSSIGSCLLGPTTRTGAISVTLTDPEVLDCPICYEPLTIPVFQCDNGHIACSPCCSKLLQKCPSCSLPIGYNRCRAMEKVLESVKIPCQNMKYGCKEIIGYGKKYGHEETCHYVPCSCPQSGCSFIGSSNQVYEHYGTKHVLSRVCFLYNHPSAVFLTTSQKFLVFQEEKEGVLFILYNKEEILGNMMTICCIGPPSLKGGYFYELTVKTDESSLKLKSLTKTIQTRVNDPPSAAFLLVPGKFFGSYGQVSLDLCIWRHGEHPSLVRRTISAVSRNC